MINQDIPRAGPAEDLQDPSQDPPHLPHDPRGPLYKSMQESFQFEKCFHIQPFHISVFYTKSV